MESKVCRLALEDGTVVFGESFGSPCSTPICGEVVFNTAMTGYQEALTDPSYSDQILLMTATQIGNYGVNSEDMESQKVQVSGFVVKELSKTVSNYRSDSSLTHWLATEGVPAITGIDTRALVRIIRESGALRGAMTTDSSISDQNLVEVAKQSPIMAGKDLASSSSCQGKTSWSECLGKWGASNDKIASPQWKVVAIDCGAKSNIYRHLVSAGCEVFSVPNTTSAAEIKTYNPDGVFISNGPGDPAAVESTVSMLKELVGMFPMFGICLGHQMLALSLGATTWKLKFGHRGANQPVREVETGKVEITSQNHGFCVDEQSLLDSGCIVTHRHLNDDTVAGFKHAELPIMGVQYHPEASPGPHDSSYLFEQFVNMMKLHAQSETL
jgi:carbamoyl-phosphate synthase small subunit